MRLIDADALKIDFYDEYETEDDAYAYGYVSKHQIDRAPTIDAVSVVHGEWKHDGSVWTYRFNCTNCGYHLLGKQTNYCPNCGCRMKGADNDIDNV